MSFIYGGGATTHILKGDQSGEIGCGFVDEDWTQNRMESLKLSSTLLGENHRIFPRVCSATASSFPEWSSKQVWRSESSHVASLCSTKDATTVFNLRNMG